MARNWKGVDKATARMRRMPQEVKRELFTAMHKNGIEITDAIRRAAPVESGKLRDSTGFRDESTPGKIAIAVTSGSDRAWYAKMVEFLHSPYFFPTIRAYKKRMKSRLNRAANKGIKKALNR